MKFNINSWKDRVDILKAGLNRAKEEGDYGIAEQIESNLNRVYREFIDNLVDERLRKPKLRSKKK